MTWPMGEILEGRRHENEGKRVDGISKQADERQKIGWEMKETRRRLMGDREDLEKGPTLIFDLRLRKRRLGVVGLYGARAKTSVDLEKVI